MKKKKISSNESVSHLHQTYTAVFSKIAKAEMMLQQIFAFNFFCENELKLYGIMISKVK